LEKIEERGFLSLYSVNKNTSFRELLKIKNNESYLNEVMVWQKYCDFFKEKHKIKIYSSTLPKNKDYYKLLTNISYTIENENSYLLSFESSTCIRNYKTIVANYLKDEGIEKFIISD